MSVEVPRNVESDTRWVLFDTKYGAPFTTSVLVLDKSFIPGIDDKSLILPYSRLTVGRKSNPNYTVGSGFEGHLCALTPQEIINILSELQNSAYRMIKKDVGKAAIHAFLEDPSRSIGIPLLRSGSTAFGAALGKARAIRSMVEQEGYHYTAEGKRETIDLLRRGRSTGYRSFVYNTQPVVDWNFAPAGEPRTLTFSQHMQNPPPSPVPIESIGADIGTDDGFRLLAELARFGHPMANMICQNYR